MLARVAWTLFVLVVAMAVVRLTPRSDFDFGRGLERCAVAGLSVSCGSVAVHADDRR